HVASQGGLTALVKAAQGGHKDTVKLLVDRGADLEAKNSVSAAAVCLLRDESSRTSRAGRGTAMAMGRPGVVLLQQDGMGGGAGGGMSDGATALVLAAFCGHKDTVKLLLDRGADLEAKDRVSATAV
ncbi:unnamed protein product, partial [Symbiodinium sp. KB8]